MTKTDRMLLIEERAGKDIRTVLQDAYEATGSLQGAANWINDQYGVSISFGIVSDWIEQGQGVVRKTIDWPDTAPHTPTPHSPLAA